MSREATLRTLETYLTACERRDIPAIVGCFAASGRIRDPLGEQVGGEAIRRYFAAIYKDLAALSFAVGASSWCGASCAVAWTGFGRRHDGHEVRYEGVDVFTFCVDDLIGELWAFWAPDDLIGPGARD